MGKKSVERPVLPAESLRDAVARAELERRVIVLEVRLRDAEDALARLRDAHEHEHEHQRSMPTYIVQDVDQSPEHDTIDRQDWSPGDGNIA
jgi:hypothetical protein